MLLRNAGDWFAVLIGQDLIDRLIEQLRGKSSLAMIFNAAGPLASHSAARSFRKASEIRLRLPLIRSPVLARPSKNGLPMLMRRPPRSRRSTLACLPGSRRLWPAARRFSLSRRMLLGRPWDRRCETTRYCPLGQHRETSLPFKLLFEISPTTS